MSSIASIPVGQLAREFGTPVFVYDADSIRQHLNALRQFDVVRFAQKACSNLAILKLLREEGACVDAVSAMEVRRGLTAGFVPNTSRDGLTPDPLVYTADIFDHDSLHVIKEYDIPVNCGSLDMMGQYANLFPERSGLAREITIRVNPGFGHGHARKTNTGGDQAKHGIWFEQVGVAKQLAAQNGLKISGIHVHIGSGTDLEHLNQVSDAALKAARLIGPDVHSISTGGGLPIPYKAGDLSIDIDNFFACWDLARKLLEKEFGHKVLLETEPGRFLVAESGFLIAEIRAVKTQGNNLFYLVDAGFNNLARPVLYGSYHPISIVRRSGQPICPTKAERVDVIIGGPLCESGDVFTQEEGGFVVKRTLPRAEVGDYLVIEITGAYSFVMGSNYNSKPFAPEVLIDKGVVRLIRKRQTYEQLIQNEIM